MEPPHSSAIQKLFRALLSRNQHLNAQAPQSPPSVLSSIASRNLFIKSIEPELTFAQEIDVLVLPVAFTDAFEWVDWRDFGSRFSRLDPIFARLQSLTVTVRSAQRGSLPFQQFDQTIVTDLLSIGLGSALVTKAVFQRYP